MLSKIRKVTEDDTDWLHEVGEEAYEDGTYDRNAAERWIQSLMRSPNHLVLRGDKAWTVAWIQASPYRPEYRTGHFLIVASLGNASRELLEMNEIVIRWAKDNGASRMYWAAINGVDFGPIAKRYGAKPVSPSYMLELYDG